MKNKKFYKKISGSLLVSISIILILISNPLKLVLAQEASTSAFPTEEAVATTSPIITEAISPTSNLSPSPTPEITLTPILLPEIGPTLIVSPLPLLLEPTSAVNSAILRPQPKVRLLNKKDYQANEKIQLILENMDSSEVKLALYDNQGKEVPFLFDEENNNQLTVLKINPLSQFKMGEYRLEVVDVNGVKTTQEFTWGVLAINPNKSIYLPDEQVNLAMAVLDNQGRMVCDADTSLEITDPTGVKTTLSTKEKTIKVNPDCAVYDVNAKPDYEASFQVKNIGIYNLSLTATTKDGTHQISDSFEVIRSVPFDIERIGPTRIYVPKQYHMGFNIKFNQDFSGEIIETVPNDFTVYPDDQISFEETKIVSPENNKKSSYSTINLIYPFKGTSAVNLNFGRDLTDTFLKVKYEKFGLIGHDGVDFDTPEGTPILATDNGKVVLAEENGDYGTTIVISHSWGQSYYGHLSQINIAVDDQVLKGQEIGLSGHTGLATGPHLHFGIKLKNNDPKNGYYGKIDPFPFLGKTAEISDFSTKQINWKVTAKAGDKLSFGYNFTAPKVSPEFYLLGPLMFSTAIKLDLSSASSPEATDSAMLVATSSPQLSEKVKKEVQSVPLFTEARQWQIAADAPGILYAATDISTFTWDQGTCASGNVFSCIDEGTVSYNDSDYITTGLNPTNVDYVHTNTTSPSDVQTVTQIIFNIRAYYTGKNGTIDIYYSTDGSDPTISAGTQITLTSSVAPYSRTVSSLSLTKAQIDALRVKFRANGTKGSTITVTASEYDITYTPTPGGPTNDQLMRHGKWFNGSGVRQPFTF